MSEDNVRNERIGDRITEMSEDDVREWIASLADSNNIPVSCLNITSRNFLAKHLDITSDIAPLSGKGIQQDWMGLAELMRYRYRDVQYLEAKSKKPTRDLLDKWSKKSGSTVQKLLNFLMDMDRFDILEEDFFRKSIERDVQEYLNHDNESMDTDEEQPIQVQKVSSSPLRHWSDHNHDEFQALVVDDIDNQGKLVKNQVIFDAFVTYTKEDLPFVLELMNKLEHEFGLKLCLDVRNLLVAGSDHTVTAKLIQDRCKRVIIVLSENFLNSPVCDFQVKFTHHLSPGSRSKKLVPLMIESCTYEHIPPILRHITKLDFEKQDLKEWFWERLTKSLRAPLNLSSDDEWYTKDLSEVSVDVSEMPSINPSSLLGESCESSSSQSGSLSTSTSASGSSVSQVAMKTVSSNNQNLISPSCPENRSCESSSSQSGSFSASRSSASQVGMKIVPSSDRYTSSGAKGDSKSVDLKVSPSTSSESSQIDTSSDDKREKAKKKERKGFTLFGKKKPMKAV